MASRRVQLHLRVRSHPLSLECILLTGSLHVYLETLVDHVSDSLAEHDVIWLDDHDALNLFLALLNGLAHALIVPLHVADQCLVVVLLLDNLGEMTLFYAKIQLLFALLIILIML